MLAAAAAVATAATLPPFVTLRAQTGPPSLNYSILPGLGGKAPLKREPWNGYLAVGGGNPSSWFHALGPLGGCSNASGNLSKTSVTAKAHKCRYAVNGGPFSMSTGACIGRNIADGIDVCPSCEPRLGASFGLGMNGTTWVVGDFNETSIHTLGLTQLISGFNWLVRDGHVVGRPGGEVAPRTALGVTSDGRLVILEVDGCEGCPKVIGGPKGFDMYSLAKKMHSLGCVHAINLDGGGSSATAIDGKLADWPTDKHIPIEFPQERAVSTIVCVT